MAINIQNLDEFSFLVSYYKYVEFQCTFIYYSLQST